MILFKFWGPISLLLLGLHSAVAVIPAAEQNFLLDFHSAMTAVPALNWTISNASYACESNWEGISCADTGTAGVKTVVGFVLRSRSLSGSLPASITNLTQLAILYVHLLHLFFCSR